MTTPDPGGDARFWTQLEMVNAALPDGLRAVAGPEGATPGSSVAPGYAELDGHVLVPAQDLERAGNMVQDLVPGEADPRVVWPPEHDAGRVSVRRLYVGDRSARLVADTLTARRMRATPVHLVSVAGVNLCPGDEPVPASGPLRPPPGARDAGAGVRVTVLDTGLVPGYLDHPWLAAGSGDPAIPAVDGDVTDEVTGGVIGPYTGHGTFVAGVVRCTAPAADVRVHRTFPYAGAVPEDELGLAVRDTLGAHGWPDIVSLSAGTRTRDAAALLGLADFMAELTLHPETVLVAAAGNDGGTDPFWPAAYAGQPVNASGDLVVSVGALREDGLGRACFSNHGDWVTVYAQGERLVNAFASGQYTYGYPHCASCRHSDTPLYSGCTCVGVMKAGDTATFTGLAQWSGTSFATPIVAGLIAARMSEAGISSRQAARQLVAGRLSVPDLSGYLR
ncbi:MULTISPECIES: S8/S53 family peptidase [Nonomuraea]|uniref:S8/S53 family peptidase n=1 Tax=Nonomuraea ferruginea TaxID=46174 RepID=A0ABT4TDI4_9ACTN|nr:S8/S53 family peptidase [Nonomuraea ferruginea]MDA0647577.1 S8/S53 family peptidase [Nonomuraea ferruginea]